MKNFLVTVGLLLILIGLIITRKEYLIEVYDTYFSNNTRSTSLKDKNEYYRDIDFLYVQNTDDFTPNNRQELINIYYSVINSGITSFSFKCSNEYSSCINDVRKLAYNQGELSDINNI